MSLKDRLERIHIFFLYIACDDSKNFSAGQALLSNYLDGTAIKRQSKFICRPQFVQKAIQSALQLHKITKG